MRGFVVAGTPPGLAELEQRFPNIRANYQPTCVEALEVDPLGDYVFPGDPFLQYIEFPVRALDGEQTFVILAYEIERRTDAYYLVYPLKVYDQEQFADRATVYEELKRIASTGSAQ